MKFNRKLRLFCFISTVFIVSVSFTGCREKVDPDDISLSQSYEEDLEEPETINPLTGLEVDESLAGKRPVSVMINNHNKALPQNGISQADLIYEVPVEGGYTRLLAFFTDTENLERVGAIRSVRHDFVELALPFNPIFIHWGGSPTGYTAVENIDSIDGMVYGNKYFITDTSLGRALEHTRFMEQEGMQEAIEALEYETGYDVPNAFDFSEDEVKFPDSAVSASVKFSTVITSTLEYDSSDKVYTKGEYDQDTLDGNTGEKVQIKNVFILYDEVSLMSDGSRVDLSLTEGNGYYLTNGTYTEITWSKGDENSKLTFKDTAGESLKVNPGNSWVMFVSDDMASSTVIE